MCGSIPEEELEVGAVRELLVEVQMGVGHLEVLPGVEGQEESHDMVLVLHEQDSQGLDGYHNQQLHCQKHRKWLITKNINQTTLINQLFHNCTNRSFYL